MGPDLLARLSRFAARDLRPGGGDRPHRPELWAFVAHDRERLAEVRIERTALIAVLEGTKELTDPSGTTRRFPAGSAMLLPPGWWGSVVNDPGSGGRYRALVLEFPAEMVRWLLRAHGTDGLAPRARPGDWHVALTPALTDAIQHAATGLTADPPLPAKLAEHRCMEVLLALLEDGVWWLGPVAPMGIADAVRQLLRTQPDMPWTAERVAGALHLSTGTLRRRLTEEGCSVRSILTEERVAHARDLLQGEGLSVQEAAEACGYANRSHFARRIRTAVGVNPSGLRGR
ncbi:transcriptional regulator [Azospirillum sp. TSH7]|uniref:helix-turn-helix transcriptional regulator n=1 Tax=unclassified Azospirillum TaxID=2630922 RepID=UPI000D61CB32|nr:MULTISPECIES: helix-turn-helix transcriptional regulator [unclassified Azospirillum]PWC54869.1 transcriptional regulator [Azospirillum sp. TSH7]PWC68285.1 transcriptional regulator [Azospirillum sp. TSH20]